MNNKELIDYLNSLKIHQTSSWDENIPEEFWDKYFKGSWKQVASKLDVDKHRWYETSITVIKINDGFIGIRSVTDTFSDSMGIRDCDYILKFYEMEEVLKPTYIIK